MARWPVSFHSRWPGIKEQGTLFYHILTGCMTKLCSKRWGFPILLSVGERFLPRYKTLKYQTMRVFQNLTCKSKNIPHQEGQNMVSEHRISEYEASGPCPCRWLSHANPGAGKQSNFQTSENSVLCLITLNNTNNSPYCLWFVYFDFKNRVSCSPGWLGNYSIAEGDLNS